MKTFLAIVGPTGSGKTALSLAVGRHLDVEIISMDSRQIYVGMNIGTGKITEEERGQIPHFGLDVRTPDQRYSAGQFSRDARGWIREIRARGRVPLLVGGTGFFLKALTDPLFAEPPLEEARLEMLRAFLNKLSAGDLHRYLEVLDPVRNRAQKEGDRQRATRAIEISLLTGRPLSWWHREGDPAEESLDGVITVLDLPQEVLYERINRRVGQMVEEGLVEEVKGLLAAGFGPDDPGMTGAGYREIVAHIRGEVSLEEATEKIRQSHRRYARRQKTWNRHQLSENAVFLDGTRGTPALVEEVLAAWSAASPGG